MTALPQEPMQKIFSLRKILLSSCLYVKQLLRRTLHSHCMSILALLLENCFQAGTRQALQYNWCKPCPAQRALEMAQRSAKRKERATTPDAAEALTALQGFDGAQEAAPEPEDDHDSLYAEPR